MWVCIGVLRSVVALFSKINASPASPCPLGTILTSCAMGRSSSRNPLASALFIWEAAPPSSNRLSLAPPPPAATRIGWATESSRICTRRSMCCYSRMRERGSPFFDRQCVNSSHVEKRVPVSSLMSRRICVIERGGNSPGFGRERNPPPSLAPFRPQQCLDSLPFPSRIG